MRVIADELGEKAKNLTLQTSLRKDVQVDSYSALQILFELEEAFAITIPDQEIKQAELPRDIVDYIQKRLAEPRDASPASTGGAA